MLLQKHKKKIGCLSLQITTSKPESVLKRSATPPHHKEAHNSEKIQVYGIQMKADINPDWSANEPHERRLQVPETCNKRYITQSAYNPSERTQFIEKTGLLLRNLNFTISGKPYYLPYIPIMVT